MNSFSLKVKNRQSEEYWSQSHGKDQGHKVMIQVNISLSFSYLSVSVSLSLICLSLISVCFSHLCLSVCLCVCVSYSVSSPLSLPPLSLSLSISLSLLSHLYAIWFLLNELYAKCRQTDGMKEYRHAPVIYLVHVHVIYREQTCL